MYFGGLTFGALGAFAFTASAASINPPSNGIVATVTGNTADF
jgi:hypothetical protein